MNGIKHCNLFIGTVSISETKKTVTATIPPAACRNCGGHMVTSSNGNIFSVTGPLCEKSTGHRWIPTQRPVTFPLICVSTNGWINNRDAGDLRRHRAHYDVTVIVLRITKSCSQQAHSHHHHLPASVSDYFQLVFSKTYRMNSGHTLKIILTYHSKQLNSVGSSRYRGELN